MASYYDYKMLAITSTLPEISFVEQYNWAGLEKSLRELLELELNESNTDLFLERWSENFWDFNDLMLIAHFYTYVDTTNDHYEQVGKFINEQVAKFSRLYDELTAHYLKSGVTASDSDIHAVLSQDSQDKTSDETRKAILDLTSTIRAASGQRKITFEGEALTPAQISKRLNQVADREERKRLWLAAQEESLAFSEQMFETYYKLFQTFQIAADESGFQSYTDMFWQTHNREFSPSTALEWSERALQAFEPAIVQLREAQEKALGVKTLKPWDEAVELMTQADEPPTELDDINITNIVADTFGNLDARFGRIVEEALNYGSVDLTNRAGKMQMKNYCGYLYNSKQPLVICQTVAPEDLKSVFHEFGHAIHFRFSQENTRNQNYWTLVPDTEISEVVAAVFELIGMTLLSERALLSETRRKQLLHETMKRTLSTLVAMRERELMQHWFFAERPPADLRLFDSYYRANHDAFFSDWSNFPKFQARRWSNPFTFTKPFQTVDYTLGIIARLLLQQKFVENREVFVEQLISLMTQGKRATLLGSLNILGIADVFSEKTLAKAFESFQTIYEPVVGVPVTPKSGLS